MSSKSIATINLATSTEYSKSCSVFVGAPDSTRSLQSTDLILVVEADQEKAQRMMRPLLHRRNVRICAEVLSVESGTKVKWFRYNDPRLNGPLTVDTWHELYPNLQPTGEELRIGRRLEELLDDWAQEQVMRHKPLLKLQLRQGDPLAALGGLGGWISLLQDVELSMPSAQDVWAKAVNNWLRERGFYRADDSATAWCRDPIATQLLFLREKEQQIAQLEEQLSTQSELLWMAQAHNQEISATCDQMRTSLDAVTAERDAFQEELFEQKARADSLALQFEKFNGELNNLLALMDQGVDEGN